ncbi:MAG: NAD-dependent epimerase/dehydratase [Parcubacteria group bacterium Gr01-1014_44]|nr:MAG: NAD-dependent epimerase/dehydratase [Parcubacteria group bacterium Gr01-1014_44]
MENKKQQNPFVSVVVTCYQDEGNIAEMHRRLTKVLTSANIDYEIIFVNDGSPDNSEAVLREIASRNQKVTVILQARNFGAQNAFTAGMEQALGQTVVIMDGDLQDPPELIPEFIKKWRKGYEVVYGIRRKREKSMGELKSWIYHMFYVVFNKISYMQVPEDAGEFSLMDRRVVETINAMPERDRLLRGLRAWVGFKQIGVKYERPERFWGKSTNSLVASTKWARKAIFSFSYAPMELVSRISFLVMFLAFAAIVIYVISYLTKGAPAGFTTLLMVVLFLGAIQLLALAIIGEYLARVFEETKQRPRYVTKEILNDHRAHDKHSR